MSHAIESTAEGQLHRVRYGWRYRGHDGAVEIDLADELRSPETGSEEEFIAEHYWGHTRRGQGTFEYEVVHPPWMVARGMGRFEGHVSTLFGERFGPTLEGAPTSSFLANGSSVAVHGGSPIELRA